jgi:hypothetical protein
MAGLSELVKAKTCLHINIKYSTYKVSFFLLFFVVIEKVIEAL